MLEIECEIRLTPNFDPDDEVRAFAVSDKRIICQKIEACVLDCLTRYVKPELGIAYRVPRQIPIRFESLRHDATAAIDIYIPSRSDSVQLGQRLTVVLYDELKETCPELQDHFYVSVGDRRRAA